MQVKGLISPSGVRINLKLSESAENNSGEFRRRVEAPTPGRFSAFTRDWRDGSRSHSGPGLPSGRALDSACRSFVDFDHALNYAR